MCGFRVTSGHAGFQHAPAWYTNRCGSERTSLNARAESPSACADPRVVVGSDVEDAAQIKLAFISPHSEDTELESFTGRTL
eukprot:3412738-Rhodomonas_salina.2